jgi:hypothetical protein
VPDAANIDAIGELTLQCGRPSQKALGPVTLEVQLAGRGNLRAGKPPHFAAGLDGEVELSEAGVTVERESLPLTMTRRWRIAVFPSHDGVLTLPPLAETVFTPAAGATQQLRCGGSTLAVRAVDRPAAPPVPAVEQARQERLRWWPRIAVGALVLAFLIALVMWTWRRARSKTPTRTASASASTRESAIPRCCCRSARSEATPTAPSAPSWATSSTSAGWQATRSMSCADASRTCCGHWCRGAATYGSSSAGFPVNQASRGAVAQRGVRVPVVSDQSSVVTKPTPPPDH